MGAESFYDRVVRNGGPPIASHAHARAVRAMAADRLVDPAAAREHTGTHGQVVPGNFTVREHPGEGRVGWQRLRHEQEPAGVLVESVHDPRPGQSFQRRRVMQQPVEQRTPEIAGARMHNKAGRLVDNQQGLVLVGDLERHRFRRRFHGRLGLHSQRHGFAADDRVPGSRAAAIHDQGAVEQPGFEPTAGIFGKQARQRLVQSLAGQILGNSSN